MAVSGGQVCTAIITKGLGCLPACEALITSHFGLAGLCVITVVVGPTGGSPPLMPGEIGNMYQPVDPPPGFEDHPAFYTPQDGRDPFSIKQQVRITVEFRGEKTEREYVVSPRRAAMIVSVANFINKTQERIDAVVKNFRKVTNRAVKILNFRKKG